MWPPNTATSKQSPCFLTVARTSTPAPQSMGPASVDTAIFHAVTQFDDGGLLVTQLLIERGADLSVRAKLPGDYERPGEIVDCTVLGYALRFGGPSHRRTVTLLRERGAVE